MARNYYVVPGNRIYPFAYVGFSPLDLPTLLRRRKNGGGWTTITGSGYTDDIQEAKLFTEVVNVYITTYDTHDLEVTDSTGTYNLTTNVYSRIKAGRAKSTPLDRKIPVFGDTVICEDPAQISAINYSVSGDATVAKTAITRDIVWSGTHTTTNDSATLKNSALDWTKMLIKVDTDIAKNITDGSEAVITALTATEITAALSGGAEDDWDIGDTYNIVDGAPLDVIAKRLRLSYSSVGVYVCTLYVTDQSANESTTSIVLTVG